MNQTIRGMGLPVRQIKQRQLHQIQYAPGDQHPSQQVPLPLAKGQKTLHPVLPFLGRRLLLLRSPRGLRGGSGHAV